MNTRMMIAIAEALPSADASIKEEAAAYLMRAASYIAKVDEWANGVLEDWQDESIKDECHCKYCGARFYVNQYDDIDDPDAEHDQDCPVLFASEILE